MPGIYLTKANNTPCRIIIGNFLSGKIYYNNFIPANETKCEFLVDIPSVGGAVAQVFIVGGQRLDDLVLNQKVNMTITIIRVDNSLVDAVTFACANDLFTCKDIIVYKPIVISI